MTIKRFAVVSLSALFVYPLSALAQTLPSRTTAPNRVTAPKARRATLVAQRSSNAAAALLKKSVDSVDWVETPFEDVVDWLKTEGEDNVNVVARWEQLSVENIDQDTLISLQLNNTTVGQVLNETLEAVSEDDALTYHAFGNLLKISTHADFDRKLYLRIYDVTDLLVEILDMGEEAPLIDLQKTNSGGGGGGGGQSVFGGGSSTGQQSGGEEAEEDMLERLQDLQTLITTAIAPQSWAGVGGAAGLGLGTISVYNRSLIVYNTMEVHEQIAGIFSMGG